MQSIPKRAHSRCSKGIFFGKVYWTQCAEYLLMSSTEDFTQNSDKSWFISTNESLTRILRNFDPNQDQFRVIHRNWSGTTGPGFSPLTRCSLQYKELHNWVKAETNAKLVKKEI